MDERATFDTQAVLAPRRARKARLALLVPVVALAITAWAGLSGRSDPAPLPAHPELADVPVASSPAPIAAEPSVEPPVLGAEARPSSALGLQVHRLVDIEPASLASNRVVALRGWWVPTGVANCPPLPALYRDGALPYLRGDKDTWAFCDRFGVLYASEPDLSDRLPTNNLEDNRSKSAGLPAVAASVVIGVIMPLALETVGGDATEVVVIAHVAGPADGCGRPAGCLGDLVVDYLAWSAAG